MNYVEEYDNIYEVDNKLVILDSDLAKLYNTETKRINETYRRNNMKFSSEQTWILSNEELEEILVARSDQKIEKRGRNKNPRVFTESGVKILSSILKTKNKDRITAEILNSFSKKII